MDYRKSSYSNADGGNCVEVASAEGVHVRDTTDRYGRTLTVTTAAWTEFLNRVR